MDKRVRTIALLTYRATKIPSRITWCAAIPVSRYRVLRRRCAVAKHDEGEKYGRVFKTRTTWWAASLVRFGGNTGAKCWFCAVMQTRWFSCKYNRWTLGASARLSPNIVEALLQASNAMTTDWWKSLSLLRSDSITFLCVLSRLLSPIDLWMFWPYLMRAQQKKHRKAFLLRWLT